MIKKNIVVMLLGLLLHTTSPAKSYPFNILPPNYEGTQYMGVDINSSLSVRLHSTQGKVAELSGIVWDDDEQTLYAVTDEGLLHHLVLFFAKDNPKKLLDVRVKASHQLRDSQGKKLSGRFSDSEGLELRNGHNGRLGDAELVVSFEREQRLERFALNGISKGRITLSKPLNNRRAYRAANKGLESVAYHPHYGFLTAAELPLNKQHHQTLYATNGRSWHFQPLKAKGSSVTGMTVLVSGNVLLLERAWGGIMAPVVIGLREVVLKGCQHGQMCNSREVAVFSSNDDWLLDNFEGLTAIGHNRFLMVSDNNNNPFQSTVFVVFSLTNTGK